MTPEKINQIRNKAGELYQDIKTKMGCKTKLSDKQDTKGFEAFVKVLEDVYCDGVKAGLESEAKAWAEVNRIEDLIIDLLRYAPDSELAQSRVIQRGMIDDDPAAYANAVGKVMGSLS